jgi:hypothetical protein
MISPPASANLRRGSATPRRSRATLAVLGVLIAGCGGGDDQAEQPPPRTVDQPPPIYDTVSNDMRRIADLAAGECANGPKIRRAMAKLRSDADDLPFDDLEAQQLVKDVLAETRDTLRSCREQKELQDAADEANRLADEIDPNGEP